MIKFLLTTLMWICWTLICLWIGKPIAVLIHMLIHDPQAIRLTMPSAEYIAFALCLQGIILLRLWHLHRHRHRHGRNEDTSDEDQKK